MGALIEDTRSWLTANFQKVNDGKTELMIISSMHHRPVDFPEFKVGDEAISPSDCIRNLGVLFDANMHQDKHINNIVKLSFKTLRDMYKVRPCIPLSLMETLVHAFITTRLDYCNSILYGLPKKLTKKLQAVQNTAARLVTNTRKHDHITPVMKELHWLPVDQRIIYKILLLTYKCHLAPEYLMELLTWKPSHGLRSDNKLLLIVPKSRLATYGERAFSVAAPKLWNPLPLHIKQSQSLDIFKCRLKTHIFNVIYNC